MKTLMIFVLLLASGSSLADWTELSSEDFSMAPPPAKKSRAWMEDFAELHRWQNKRTESDCNEAATMVHAKYKALFLRSGGLTNHEVELTEKFMGKVFRVGERIADSFKKTFTRKRPYDTDSTLEPCVKKPGGQKSYPSFHAAAGALGACVLGEIFAEKADRLKALGDRVGELRVIAGVHHPSDIAAGSLLGREICARLLRDAGFRREIKAIH